MERWRELVAGYVLDNLNEEEHRELTQILLKRPELVGEIARLKRTATIRGSRRRRGLPAYSPHGADGASPH